MRTQSSDELIPYKRKSTDTEDKQILSLPDQNRVITDYGRFRKLPLSKKFDFEESKSAKNAGRPLFNQMVELLRQGKAKGVISYKSDRLTRNFTDLGTLIELIETDKVEVWATDYGQYKVLSSGLCKPLLSFVVSGKVFFPENL